MATTNASSFRFNFQLTGAGWAAGELADDYSQVTVTASYLGEPLACLLDAVTQLVEGESQAECSWDEEPGEFRWLFHCHRDTLQLTILEFEKLWGKQPNSDGRTVFYTEQPMGTFARTILAGADAVLHKYGEAGYLEKWVREPFPVDRVESLRLALALHPRF